MLQFLVRADHVSGLTAKRLLAGLGAGRDLDLDAPGDFLFVIFEEGEFGKSRLFLLDRVGRRRPVAVELQAVEIKEVELRVFGTVVGLFLGVFIDVPGSFELGRDLVSHRVAGFLPRLARRWW